MAETNYYPSGLVTWRLIEDSFRGNVDFIGKKGVADIELSVANGTTGIRYSLTLDEARELSVELGKAVDFLEKD